MDSREMLEFFSELERTFKIKISFDDIDNLIENNQILTIQTIVNYLEKTKKSVIRESI
jgi:acyl carrier protein